MEISEIKARLSLSQVLAHYGLKPDKHLQLCCPFHKDRTPSMKVYYKTHTAYCFSSNCPTHGRSLDVIDFVMHKEGLNKHQAILKAQELIGGEAAPVGNGAARPQLLGNLFTYFRNAVHNSAPAQEYLQRRHLLRASPSGELSEGLRGLEVGYNSGQFHHGARKDETLIESCVRAGLLIPTGGAGRSGAPAYTPFGKGCIVFPLKDKEGRMASLYFRSTRASEGGGRHYYLKDRQGLYPAWPKPSTRRLILTEAIIDAATLLQDAELMQEYGVLGLYGTNGLTEEHKEAIGGLQELEEMIFFFDGDESGQKAAQKYKAILGEQLPGTVISQVQTPEGEDVNSLLDGHAPEILRALIKNRTLLFSSTEKPTEDPGNSPLLGRGVGGEGETKPAATPASHTAPASAKSPSEKEEGPSDEKKSAPAGKPLDTRDPHDLIYQGIAARYHVKGWRPGGLDSLKVSLRIVKGDEDHRARVELYEHKQVEATAKYAAQKLGTDAALIGKDLGRLATLLEAYRATHQGEEAGGERQRVQVPQATQAQCIARMKAPNWLDELNAMIGKAGVIGEEKSRLLLYVIASTYKMAEPLHALVQGSSGSGKTHLIGGISALMPPEDVIPLTRVTESSFYNYGEHELRNKLLVMEDLDGLKEEAFLAFRELQSRGMLNSSTSVKDEQGNIRAALKRVCGPIASLSATTKGAIYEDNMSRCLVIAVDESAEQTRRVIGHQDRRAAGLVDTREEERTTAFLQHCMRLLAPCEVVNPYAGKVRLPQEAQKVRRLNQLYQGFIKQVTVLHQYQRQRDQQGRLIAEKEDLRTACRVLFDSIVLKVDELDGTLRDFYEQLKEYVGRQGGREYAFNRREVRQAIKVSRTRQHAYLWQLQELEYIRPAGGHANRGFQYTICYWDSLEALRAKIQDQLDKQLEQL